MPDPIVEENLSYAWGRAFLAASARGVNELVPLLVTVTDFSESLPSVDHVIREALDNCLEANGRQSCHTVANTIFPASLWNSGAERQRLYDRYLAILPRLRRMHTGNRYGLYFERLIVHGGQDDKDKVNQLEHIVTTWQLGNHRRSALQAAILEPVADHTDQRQRGFPCLQHVIFTPLGEPLGAAGLAVTGVYATQYLFERAYGNYLGLCRLGRFVAHECGLQLARMHCFSAVAKRAEVPKSRLASLTETVRERLEEVDSAESRV